jgi:membrane-bound lytic murein transglycosylase D
MNHDLNSTERPRCTRASRPDAESDSGGTPVHADAGAVLRRIMRWTFVPLVVLTGLVIMVAAQGVESQDEDVDVPFPVADATAALMDTRLPMEVNDRVERWVRRFLGPDRATFEEYLVREGLYGGLIRDRLRQRDMPEQLLYLAMIESGFSPTATSPMAASGVWQFMGPTARAYGLTVDGWVDERRDPVRATDAALDYLEELHQTFDSWYLAAAAYNAGPGRVSQALRRSGLDEGGDEKLYWEVIEHLPRETRSYVPKLLAAALLAEQPGHFGFEVERSLPYLFDQVLVPGGVSLVRLAGILEIEPSLMSELNPHLVRGATPPGRSILVRVPMGESQKVVAALGNGRS